MCMHGDKEQRERDWVLNEFRTGRNPILIATDVASRGLGESKVYKRFLLSTPSQRLRRMS